MALGSAFVALTLVVFDCAETLTVSSAKASTDSTRAGPFPAIAWFHVPRCGGSFQFNLLSLHELCNDTSIAADERSNPSTGQVQSTCSRILIPEDQHCKPRDGFALCAEYTSARAALQRNAKLVGMFRQPEQRLISDWNWANDRVNWKLAGAVPADLMGNGTVADFARIRQGCAMRMLIDEIEQGPLHCAQRKAPTFKPEERMDEALEVLEKFSFVGLYEEWALSMCLFNKMFGTPCRAEQVWDLKNHHTTGGEHDKSSLDGWVDDYDAPVYERAKRIFADNLEHYDVSEDTCATCFQQMGMD